MSKFDTLAQYYRLFGWPGVAGLVTTKIQGKPTTMRVKVSGVSHPVHLRCRTSDERVFDEVFVQQEYKMHLRKPAQVIVDCGANIGLTAVFFANTYPHARIFAIEPEPKNFAILEANS